MGFTPPNKPLPYFTNQAAPSVFTATAGGARCRKITVLAPPLKTFCGFNSETPLEFNQKDQA